jgi:hypothetical protein
MQALLQALPWMTETLRDVPRRGADDKRKDGSAEAQQLQTLLTLDQRQATSQTVRRQLLLRPLLQLQTDRSANAVDAASTDPTQPSERVAAIAARPQLLLLPLRGYCAATARERGATVRYCCSSGAELLNAATEAAETVVESRGW